jgi:hypothetical protein
MLRWRDLHPYCASHVIAIDAPLDEARLRRTIAEVLEACGLTGLDLAGNHRSFAFEGGPASVTLDVVDGGDEPFNVAAERIESTINEPFPRMGRFDPFRFFAIRSTATSFLLGLTYDHFIAGGDSIAVLVTDIADRYTVDAPLPPMPERYPPGYARLFLAQAAAFARGLASLPALLVGWRSAIRPHIRTPGDGTNGFAHFRVDASDTARVSAAAKRWGVTQNALLLACVLRAVAPIASQRRHTGRRTKVALATIVNVRRDYQPPATEVFGQFLSSFRVVHPLPRDEPIEALARALSKQARTAIELKLYLMTLVAMGAAALLWPFADTQRRQRLYLKYHPVFAGFTPLNVEALRRRVASRDDDYLRAASTGPMAPMVVAVTRAGAALRVGITYRTGALEREDVHTVIASLQQSIESLP